MRDTRFQSDINAFMEYVRQRNSNEPEFHQAVQEFVESVLPYCKDHPEYLDANILERIVEPDRIISFRVTWEDDEGNFQVNRGYRVQFNNSIGPYKGGLRFHPSVNQSILKFLGFEQIFKNSLTTLPMGGGKGGSDFNPKGKTDREVMRFCQAFMTELSKHVGAMVDIPAGDIGVGSRELGFLFGSFKKLKNEFSGSLTGKGLEYGGSLIRTEATGYGNVYFVREMLNHIGQNLEGKRCVVSGSGNVAQYSVEKILELGGKVITLSDSSGFIYDPDGITQDKLNWVIDLKTKQRGRIHEYAEKFGCEYHETKKPWSIPCDVALPSATQNELNESDARVLIENGCRVVSEGANMPCTIEAVHAFQNADVLYAPGKAANAGGVAVSGLEQAQNAQRLVWTREEVDRKLQEIMRHIHRVCVEYGASETSNVDYVRGANVGGFKKVADAMRAYGCV